jgi:MATE family multidrug resistance protein
MTGAAPSVVDVAAVVTRPSLRQLLTLALPIVVSRSSQVVVGFTDAAMVGQLSQSALAATTAGATNAFNILVLPMGMVFVVQSFAAQLTGRGDAAGARRYGWYGLGLAAVTQLVCLASLPLLPRAVALFDYAPDVQHLMATYLYWRLMSGGAAIGLEALANYYGGLGNTRLPMAAQLVVMALNVVLCWVLIYGHLGAPALGVAGSAIAASVATTVGFFLLFGLFVAGVGCGARRATGFSARDVVRLLKVGVPSGFNWFIEFAAFSFFMNVVLPGLGTTTIAAMMSVIQLNSVSFMPAFALASSGAIFVGQAIGAGKKDDVARTVRLTMIAAAAWMGLLATVYVTAPRFFLGAFVVDGAADAAHFLDVGARILLLSCAWQLFDAASMVLSEALRAAGDTLATFVARAAIAWGVFVPGAWLTVRRYDGGDVAAVAWLAAYLALLSAVLWLRFRSGQWRNITLTDDDVSLP